MIYGQIPSKRHHSEGKNFLEHFIVLQGSWVTKANNFLGEIEELNGAVCISGHVRKTSLFVMLQISPWDSACAAVGRDWVCLSVSPEDCHWVWSESLLPSQQLVAVCPAPARAAQHIHGTNLSKGFRNHSHLGCAASENLPSEGNICSTFVKAAF